MNLDDLIITCFCWIDERMTMLIGSLRCLTKLAHRVK
jgi:hypothetical protein